MVTINAFSFFITFCQVSENIHTHHKEFHLSQEGGVSYQSKFIRQRGVAAIGRGGGKGGIGYFLEPHILSSGRNVLSNHNTLNSLMKNPVAQETWLEKIRFQSPFFYTPLGHHKGTSCP